MGGIAQGTRKFACTVWREDSLHPPMPHSWVFYRNREAFAKLRLRGLHRIAQHANTGDADLHCVAGNKWSDASGRACSDDVAGHQRHHAGNPADQKRGRIGHQRGDARLAARAVYARLNQQIGWIKSCFDVRSDGAESIETLAARELNVTFLKVARGDIVEAGVTHHEGKRIFGIAEVRAAPANDQGEFSLVFHALRIFCQDDCFFRTNNGRGRFEKHQRLFRDFVAHLRGVGSVIAADADDFRRLDRSEQPHVGEARRTRAARPFGPGRAGDLDDIFSFDQSIARRSSVRRGSAAHQVTADFHRCSARPVVWMRSMRFTGSPDRGYNPAKRSENHIHDSAQHENLGRAEPIAEPPEDHAEHAIAEAENQPSDKARCHEVSWQAQKPKNGNRRDAENVEPTVTRQMRTYQHEVAGPQVASNRLTRIYGDGCVTSTATGVLGTLSFQARSTAVTVYQ